MSSTGNTNPGNFANRPKEEVSEIAKKGGQASHAGNTSPGNFANRPKEEVSEIAKKGGQASHAGNTNPGNFANRPKEEVSEIAKKGGQASHGGGFASMDPEKQVISIPSSSHISEIDGDNVYRRKLHPWAGKPPADRLKRAARQPRRPERRAEVLLEE